MALVLDGNGTMTVGNGAVSGITTPISVTQGGTARATVPAYFHGFHSSDSGNMSASTWSKAPLSSSTVDNVSGFISASNRYQIQTGYAGYYLVSYRARIRWSSGTQANQLFGAVYKNGSLFTQSELDLTGNYVWTTTFSGSLVMNLVVGDYIELYGYATNMAWIFKSTDSSLTMIQLSGV